ncbi:Cytosolic sulfotransferase [Thalictrum thalictroides]|uniref:Sulfotransferase n=1 Tax=Thalictrum thalictroides TaxID=46969 RepID=A0A7J6VAF8_THATH|nr:Cytosolic sulfotransferase [Thalictrum thalictroides]
MADLFGLLNATSDSANISVLLSQLPKAKWLNKYDLYQWEGLWYFPAHIESTLAFQTTFEARDDDVIIASSPKAGTTWLKALVSSILNEWNNNSDELDPLTKENPHNIVMSLEGLIYLLNLKPDLSGIPSPRIFHTHLPYHVLPESIKKSKCKIVYIARNPKDTFVSLWHFMNTLKPEDQDLYPIDQAFEDFCKGIHFFGPYNDHVLAYWNESLKCPKKVHFLKYEDLKKDPKEQVKKLGEFLEKPFVNDEEVDQVLWRCSIERLQNLEVNVSGSFPFGLRHSSFFRLGVVGDWKNCFTKEMSDRLDHIARSKFEGSGLNLDIESIE